MDSKTETEIIHRRNPAYEPGNGQPEMLAVETVTYQVPVARHENLAAGAADYQASQRRKAQDKLAAGDVAGALAIITKLGG